MKQAKRKRVESAGWRVGTAGQFLGLSRAEEEVVEVKLVLGASLRRLRQRRRMTQGALAKRLGSSQSRVAKLEAGALGVSLDLLFRALFAAGASREQVARAIRQHPVAGADAVPTRPPRDPRPDSDDSRAMKVAEGFTRRYGAALRDLAK